MHTIFKFFYSFTSVLLTAYICSVFTHQGLNSWYFDMPLPSLTPPSIVFSIAWSVIYVLLIISFFMSLRIAGIGQRNKVNNLFLINLALQILWCFTFFATGHIALGLAIILVLDIAAFRLTARSLQINKFAGYLLYPYYWWLLFATFLNANFVYNFGLAIVF